jgi:hypothetical protein
MSVGKAVEWAIIAVIALIALKWLAGIFEGGMLPIAAQQPGIGGWTNISPVTGPVFVTAGYQGGWRWAKRYGR